MADGVFTPYSTISAFVSAFTGWVPALDKERIASYQSYEEIYWNHPETFKLVVRGTENNPIYIPSGRIITDTVNRYLAKDVGFNVQPAPGVTAGTGQALGQAAMEDWFRREAFRSKFSSSKLYGIMRGDWLFHVVANPLKPEGSRVSIRTIDPATYFPVYHDDDLDKLIKVHLVEEFQEPDGKVRLKKETYEKDENGTIIHSVSVFDPDKAFSATGGPEYVPVPPTPLPPEITAIPVYLIKNFDQPGNPFGSSEMRGLERIMAAINQAVSDEDIALALEGLGVYATPDGGPVDEEGNDVPWVIAPGRVLENVTDFKRIQGVGSVQPFTDHIKTLWDFTKQAAGTNDAAIGRVDVQVAESGVALQLELGPILARCNDKLQLIDDTLSHLFFDLRNWFKVYEGWNLDNTRITPTFGDPLPQNRKAEVDLVSSLVTGKVMSAATARKHLAKFGFEFDANEDALIAASTAAEASAVDPYANRLQSESAPDGEVQSV